MAECIIVTFSILSEVPIGLFVLGRATLIKKLLMLAIPFVMAFIFYVVLAIFVSYKISYHHDFPYIVRFIMLPIRSDIYDYETIC